MKRRILLLTIALLTSVMAFAQNGISGLVVDQNGEPLPGVAVISDNGGAKTGVTTDFEGKFTINVPAGTSLEFSYLGFKNVTLDASNAMNVVLEEDRNVLDEAVVIGYGTVKKKDILGSVSTVREAALQDRKSSGVVSSMQGLMPGVNITSSGTPGSGASIKIRGIGSFT
ncbi:MAG: carboxypeptidase-like regulatory domain-containing protein, partial [Bacteroidales bacterium]|nr:carboxypeptidase-like regulatory domain-containing protein [Bacteroidales bacterium]